MVPRSLRILQDRCNHERDCDITAISENFGGDPCPGVPKYLEVYFGCFPETSTSTTTTPNPLPPWLTTRSALSFLPGLYDFDIDLTPPPRRIPVTAPAETTSTTTASTSITTSTKTTTVTTKRSQPEETTTLKEAKDTRVNQLKENTSANYDDIDDVSNLTTPGLNHNLDELEQEQESG